MTEPITAHALSKTIGSIYDCALDPTVWETALTEIMALLRCQTASLHLNDLRRGRMLIDKTLGIEPHWMAQFPKYLPEIMPLLVSYFAAQPSRDTPHVISRHTDRAFRDSSPYMQECLKPQGFVDIMQYTLTQTPTRFAGFGVARHERQGMITDREIEIGGLLLPHIRRAVTISDVLDARTIERNRMEDALDAVRCAVLFVDEHGAVLHANDTAEHMLQDGSFIQVVRDVLTIRAPSAAAELRAALRFATRDETRIGDTGLAICITEAAVPPLFAHVLPLTGSERRVQPRSATVAAVFIGGMQDPQDAALATAATFGLTPAQTRLLASLLGGHTMADTAAALAISATTARTHLDDIFSRTGVKRQSELMRLGLGLVPPTVSRK